MVLRNMNLSNLIDVVTSITHKSDFAGFQPPLEEQITQLYTGVRFSIGWSKDVSDGNRQALLACHDTVEIYEK